MAQSSQIQSSDERYRNQVDTDPQSRFIQNTIVDRGSRERTPSSRPNEDGGRKRMRPRYQGMYENVERDESNQAQRVENRYYQENKFSKTPKEVGGTILKSGRAIFFRVFSWSVSIFIAPTQAIFLALGFTMMGMASQSEETWTAWLAAKAAEITGWILGFEYPDLMSMAIGSFLFAGILGLSFLFLFVLTALILGLHPFNGKGADQKHGSFILAILLSPVPFGSIRWIQAVWKNPK